MRAPAVYLDYVACLQMLALPILNLPLSDGEVALRPWRGRDVAALAALPTRETWRRSRSPSEQVFTSESLLGGHRVKKGRREDRVLLSLTASGLWSLGSRP